MAAIESLTNGKLLQIMFSEGIRNQLSRDARDWDMIKQMKVGDASGRSLRYMLQTSFGPAAIQYRNANHSVGSGAASSAVFPRGQEISTQELEAEFKEIDMTVEVSYNLWNRLQKSKDARYFDQLAAELQSKMDAAKRRFSADLYGDGTGVLGTCSATNTVESGMVRFTLSSANSARGHAAMFEKGDILVLQSATAGASAFNSDLGTEPVYWQVVSRRRSDNSVLLQGLDSSYASVTIASITTPTTAGDVFFRYGQPSKPNLSTISDYGFATEVFTGLESLAAADGRVVNGLTMSGFTAGSRFDAGATALDVMHLQAALDDAKINAGEGAYAYKRMIMAPEAHASFIESREGDRRFNSVQDNKRGVSFFAFQHRNDSVETYVSEYCPKNRIWMLPENKATKDKVIEFYGSDFEPVKVNDSGAFRMKQGSNGTERMVQTNMEAYVQLVCKHPAAICVVENFTL